MERIALRATALNLDLRFIGLTALGCGLITLGSLIRIPLYALEDREFETL